MTNPADFEHPLSATPKYDANFSGAWKKDFVAGMKAQLAEVLLKQKEVLVDFRYDVDNPIVLVVDHTAENPQVQVFSGPGANWKTQPVLELKNDEKFTVYVRVPNDGLYEQKDVEVREDGKASILERLKPAVVRNESRDQEMSRHDMSMQLFAYDHRDSDTVLVIKAISKAARSPNGFYQLPIRLKK